ncbi:MAG: hypothetical protein U0232_04895 [Thermomicrobiales bacterium]
MMLDRTGEQPDRREDPGNGGMTTSVISSARGHRGGEDRAVAAEGAERIVARVAPPLA